MKGASRCQGVRRIFSRRGNWRHQDSLLDLLPGRPDVGVVHLRRKLQADRRLGQVVVERAHHDKHERLGVAAEGILKQVCELEIEVVKENIS